MKEIRPSAILIGQQLTDSRLFKRMLPKIVGCPLIAEWPDQQSRILVCETTPATLPRPQLYGPDRSLFARPR